MDLIQIWKWFFPHMSICLYMYGNGGACTCTYVIYTDLCVWHISTYININTQISSNYKFYCDLLPSALYMYEKHAHIYIHMRACGDRSKRGDEPNSSGLTENKWPNWTKMKSFKKQLANLLSSPSLVIHACCSYSLVLAVLLPVLIHADPNSLSSPIISLSGHPTSSRWAPRRLSRTLSHAVAPSWRWSRWS